MQLYSYFRSSASYRVRIAMNLKGLPFDELWGGMREAFGNTLQTTTEETLSLEHARMVGDSARKMSLLWMPVIVGILIGIRVGSFLLQPFIAAGTYFYRLISSGPK